MPLPGAVSVKPPPGIVPAVGVVSVIVSDKSASPVSTSVTLRPPNRYVAPALSFRLVAVSEPEPVGSSFVAVTETVCVAALLVSPSPSVSTKRTVRFNSDGLSEKFSNVTFLIRVCEAAGVELALNVITRGVEPSVPPANVPIVVPSYVTFEPLTPIWPVPVPSLRIARRSFVVPLAVNSTVSVPVSKSVESASLTVAVPSIIVAASPSSNETTEPGNVMTGAWFVTVSVTVVELPSVVPSFVL